MITFLWMLYLAFSLLMILTTVRIIFNLDKNPDKSDVYRVALTCLLWSIWYFYHPK